jgi:IS1 family transposase
MHNGIEGIVEQNYDAYLRGKHYRINKKFDTSITREYYDWREESARHLDEYINRSKLGLQMDDKWSDYNHQINSSHHQRLKNEYTVIIEKTHKSIVEVIKKIVDKPDDQARIAVSMVQNIPYDYDQYESLEHNGPNGRWQYNTYDVLLNNKGICSEKSSLLTELLKELGFGTAQFYMPIENHMAAAIKVNNPGYRNTGYAFIESTTPSIIGYNDLDKEGIHNPRELLGISDGKCFDNTEELHDVHKFNNSYRGIKEIRTMWGKYQASIPTEKNILKGIY